MSGKTVSLSISDSVATITLDQPERRNALSEQLIDDTRAALASVEADADVRALILTANGAAFCAGGDLSLDLPEDPEARSTLAGGNLRDRVNPLVREFRNLRCPTIAAVQAVAAGAGASLALAADITLAARSAYFLFPFMPRLGIVPDGGGTWLLPAKLGQARAMGLALIGEPLSAEQAEAWGLIWSSMEDDALMPAARKLAQRLAKGPRHAATELRKAFAQAQQNDFEQQLDYELDAQWSLLGSREFAEGVRAFMSKRDPEFP